MIKIHNTSQVVVNHRPRFVVSVFRPYRSCADACWNVFMYVRPFSKLPSGLVAIRPHSFTHTLEQEVPRAPKTIDGLLDSLRGPHVYRKRRRRSPGERSPPLFRCGSMISLSWPRGKVFFPKKKTITLNHRLLTTYISLGGSVSQKKTCPRGYDRDTATIVRFRMFIRTCRLRGVERV